MHALMPPLPCALARDEAYVVCRDGRTMTVLSLFLSSGSVFDIVQRRQIKVSECYIAGRALVFSVRIGRGNTFYSISGTSADKTSN